jgi:hypothetical protein
MVSCFPIGGLNEVVSVVVHHMVGQPPVSIQVQMQHRAEFIVMQSRLTCERAIPPAFSNSSCGLRPISIATITLKPFAR